MWYGVGARAPAPVFLGAAAEAAALFRVKTGSSRYHRR